MFVSFSETELSDLIFQGVNLFFFTGLHKVKKGMQIIFP